ncbi:MAG TPA: MerR family transcriptional regulator [Candidatus Limnocylindria bacterium]|jgi:DNA-binding transcriptional MerR regulator
MYTIKQASARSGVGIPLLRAWERRYGVVEPVRTPAGYRLYDDEAIDRLRAMRRLVEGGWSPREAASRVRSLATDTVRSLAAGQAEASGAAAAPAERGQLVGRIVDAAANLDRSSLEAALDEAFATARFEAAAQGVVLPAMVGVGEAWARGELDVGAEHAASAAVLRRLGAAFQAAGSAADGPTVIVGLPPGSQHELAALAFATAARRGGMDVVYLGADVPVGSWRLVAGETGAVAIVLGAIMEADAASAGDVLAALANDLPEVVRAVGGRHAADVPGDGHLVLPEELGQAVATLDAALPRRPRSRRR